MVLHCKTLPGPCQHMSICSEELHPHQRVSWGQALGLAADVKGKAEP